MSTDHDAIVIGSGMGGLAAASLLTQVHRKRVLVLEKHWLLGGFTHSFSRDGFCWDVGLHYVGQMELGDTIRRAFDFILQGRVAWEKMRSPFEVFSYPGFRFEVPDRLEDYQARLGHLFPEEIPAIQRYFRDVQRVASLRLFLVAPNWAKSLTRIVAGARLKLAERTVSNYLSENFHHPRLRALLCSQWGDYGLPPAQASFFIHSLIVSHYLSGAHYPVGGAVVIARAVRSIIEEGGGRCLTRTNVTSVLVKGGRVTGVRVIDAKGRDSEMRAPLVFANCGWQSLLALLPAGAVPPGLSEEAAQNSPGSAVAVLYLGLREDPVALGIHGQNFWIYRDWDHDRIWSDAEGLLDGRANHAYVSFPSLKDPEAKRPTAEIIAFIPPARFALWKDTTWQKRPLDYMEAKRRIAKALLSLVEEEIPGFGSLIEYQELSTPLTTEYFTSHSGGQIYGLPWTPRRLHSRVLGPQTPIRGLYVASADTAAHGIAGAMMGGAVAVSSALGWTTFVRMILGAIPRPRGSG
ncbi:MAG: phytoene desaturase family protein [Verrucomicrobiia bacterium]